MFSIISTPERYEQIKGAIGSRGEVLYEKTVSGEDIVKIFDEAGRVNSSTLILDIDFGPGADLVKGVKKFRVARPYARVILLAPGRGPGDQTISQLLSKGVYDIVAPNIPEKGEPPILPMLIDVVEKEPATYGDVVRWDVEPGEEEERKGKKQTVYLEKYIGTGFICVIGARRGVGCTTLAMAMANYLASMAKKKVGLVELTHYPVLRWAKGLHKNVDVLSQGEGTFKLYQEDIKNPLEEIVCQDYGYIVLDMGVVFEPEMDQIKRKDMKLLRLHEYRGEILRANLTVMVMGSGPWDYLYLEPHVRFMEKALSSWTVFTVGEPGGEIRSVIEEKVSRVITTPHISSPLSFEFHNSIKALLQPILP
jgi:hypothetical protein